MKPVFNIQLLLCSWVLLSACGPKNPVDNPIADAVQDNVNASEQSETNNSSTENPFVEYDASSETSETDSAENATEMTSGNNEQEQADTQKEKELAFADSVNNSVALLTGDEEAIKEGLKQLKELLKSHPDSAILHYNIGVANMALKNNRGAEAAFNEVITYDPTFAKAWANLGVMLEREEKYQEAYNMYSEGLKHVENDMYLTAGQIACLRKMNRFDEAIAYAQVVLKQNANNILAYNEIANIYIEQEEFEKALFVLRQTLLNNKGGGENALIQSNLGKVYFHREDIVSARTSFEKSVSLDPNLIDAALLLAFIHIDNRNWIGAFNVLRIPYQLEPTNPAILNTLGIVYRGLSLLNDLELEELFGEEVEGQDKYSELVELYKKAESKEPEDVPKGFKKLCIDESEKMYRKALQFAPNNPQPLLNLAILEADYRQEYQKAYALLDEYVNNGGTANNLVEQWRKDFEKSEQDYLRQKKREAFFAEQRRKAEERAKKQAEEEERLKQEAQENQENQNPEDPEGNVEEGSEDSETEDPNKIETEPIESNTEDSSGSDWGTEGNQNQENAASEEGTEENISAPVQEDQPEDDSNIQTDENAEENPEPVEQETEQEALEEEDTGSNSALETPSEATEESSSSDTENDSAENSDENQTNTEGENVDDQNVSSPNNEATQDDVWGWGGEAMTNCSIQEECSQGLLCSSEGICKSPGEFGTLLEGDQCSETAECSFGLECAESTCQKVEE